MTRSQLYEPERPESEINTQFHIIGRLHLQNELFAQALAAETGLNCTFTTYESLPYLLEKNGGNHCVILWDCVGAKHESIWNEIEPILRHENCQLVLFNVTPGQDLETQAVRRGVRGIFYQGDLLPAYKKGMRAILNGQLWVSREVLEKSLSRIGKSNNNDDNRILLTFREQEILSLIAMGLSKDDIADDLGISPHTVKTHTHNIYQKINVSSRVKAALWATRNLDYPKKFQRGIGRAISPG